MPEGFAFEEASQGVEAYRLESNGLQVLLLRDATTPVATFMVTYLAGSRHEPEGRTGAFHFLEHLMFKGSARFNKEAGASVFSVLQRTGARVNATTSLDRTNYYEMLPGEHLPLAVEIEADRMRGALLRDEDMERERTVILNELDRGENDPIRKLFHAVWSAAFTVHPYHHPVIGWRKDVEQMTPAGLRQIYDTWYRPDNATVSVIGDFDKTKTLERIRRHFGSVANPEKPLPVFRAREPAQEAERRVVVRQAGWQGAVMIAWKSPCGLDADTDALDMLSVVLSAGKNSRLYRRLTNRGVATSAWGSVSRFRDPGLAYVFARPAPGKTHEEVESAIHEAVDEIRENGVEEEELRRAINQRKAQAAFSRDGSFSAAAELSEALAAGDWKLYTSMQDRLSAVAAQDVQRVARQYFVRNACTTGRYIPDSEVPA